MEDVITAAVRHEGWERLGYVTHDAWVTSALTGLLALVRAFFVELVEAGGADDVAAERASDRPTLGACEVHRIYLDEGAA